MLRQTTGYGQTGICFVMTKTAMLKGYTFKVVCEICGKESGHYSDRFVTATNGSSLLIICIGPRNGQAVVEMKRFLKPRSGCGRPDLGENVHRNYLEKTFHFMAPFLAMAKLKQAWLCPSGLTKTFYFIAPFLAMAKLKQAWLCSSGLTKTFHLKVIEVSSSKRRRNLI